MSSKWWGQTTWLALDEEGYVGLFVTGEVGVLPRVAATTENVELETALERLRTVQYLLRDPEAKERFGETATVPAADDGYTPRVYVVVAPDPQDVQGYRQGTPDRASFEAAFLHVEWTVMRDAVPRVLLSVDGVSRSEVALMRAHPHVRLVAEENEIVVDYGDEKDDGLFHFYANHSDDRTYVRRGPTEDRLKVDALPMTLREAASDLELGLRFADHEKINVADHVAHDQLLTYGGDTHAERIRRVDDPHWFESPRGALLAKVVAYGLIGLTVVALIWLLGRWR